MPKPPRVPPPVYLLNSGKAVADLKPSLWFAVENKSTEEVRRLLKAGADPNIKYKGLTPLMKAAEEGYLEIMEVLLDSGCEIDAVNSTGRTALSFAASPSGMRVEQPEAVELLLCSAANTTLVDSRGWTAKDWAVHENIYSAIAVFDNHDSERQRSKRQRTTKVSFVRSVLKKVCIIQNLQILERSSTAHKSKK